jgi:Pyruvate/2-oxoacid:ferredoxin oxidoreductase delta subunit
MTLVHDFVAAFEVWEEARSYLHLMVDEEEMGLVLAVAEQAAAVDRIAELLGMSPEGAAELVQRAYARHLLDRAEEEGRTAYKAGSFYGFLDYFAKHEHWDEIPVADRRRIDCRFLQAFIDRHRANVARKMRRTERGLEAEDAAQGAAHGAVPNDAVLLLPEAEEMVEAARQIVLEPCDCRRLGQHCERPVDTCLWFDDAARSALERGHGRPLTKEEAKEVLRRADRRGLMHTGDTEWRRRGLHAICNCCACDCYPFRAAQELGSKGIWPRARYVAVYERAQCNLCGACVQRCHFRAFYHKGTTVAVGDKQKADVGYDSDRCWGCGLCANTCSSGAITMRRTERRLEVQQL